MEDSAEPVVEVLEDTVLLEEIFPGDATAFGNLHTHPPGSTILSPQISGAG